MPALWITAGTGDSAGTSTHMLILVLTDTHHHSLKNFKHFPRWLSYFQNGNSYTGKASWYWISAHETDANWSLYGQSCSLLLAQTNVHCAGHMMSQSCHYIQYSALDWSLVHVLYAVYTLTWLQTPLPFCRTPLFYTHIQVVYSRD